MSKRKRSLWDDVVEIGRDIIEKIDNALHPERKQPKPVRVPVPVRNRLPNRDSY